MANTKYVALDFDGTLVTHEFPNIGTPVPFAKAGIDYLVSQGVEIILYTMRSGEYLNEALQYCADNGIRIHHANFNPTQSKWTNSPKVYAHWYIDDSSMGGPMRYDVESESYVVDWKELLTLMKTDDIVRSKLGI